MLIARWIALAAAIIAPAVIVGRGIVRRDKVTMIRGVRVEVAYGAKVDLDWVRRTISSMLVQVFVDKRDPGHLYPVKLRFVPKRPGKVTATTTGRGVTNEKSRRAVVWDKAPEGTVYHELWHLVLMQSEPTWSIEEHHDYMETLNLYGES